MVQQSTPQLIPFRAIDADSFTPPRSESDTSSQDGYKVVKIRQQANCDQKPIEAVSKPYPLPPVPRQKKVLPEDLKTPDHHVSRDPRLLRLTGIHPFNVEAPLSELYDQGFLTDEDLHYVRNHGGVPQCEDEDMLDWSFTVEGMVGHPLTLSLRDLLTTYDQSTYPVTLVCAGNRRKEQNIVRKSKGFSWGAAGLSTALWTGVPLKDIIHRANPKPGARYVCFESADTLPNGSYGTSLKLNWCLDPNRGIMIAHKMNGQSLHPDHGKPVRAVVPGQIGGRSVKWLKKIVVTAEPSDHWYHIYDNRVLPTMITPEESANAPETWKDENYAIYDLNVNSALCYPAHDEFIPAAIKNDSTYLLRGYAYSGGGRRVTRTEITLDKGKIWRVTRMSHPEDDYRLASEGDELYGGRVDMDWRESSFCWSFWELEVPIRELRSADDIMVRAMDSSMMPQPRDMYWSVLGMMNNPWFRVVIHRDDAGALRFEHPTQPALIPGGWMERVKKTGANLTNGFWGEASELGKDRAAVEPETEKDIAFTDPKVDRKISLEELRAHANDAEPWFVLNGEVFNGTNFLGDHPGGAVSITAAAGSDATEEFMAIHSETAKSMMPDYHIGTLDKASRITLLDTGDEECDSNRSVFLQSHIWCKAILESKKAVSKDSFIFSFGLDYPGQQIGLPTGQHLMMRLRDPVTRNAIIRPYTPLSESRERGKLRVLVKVYYDTPAAKGGQMTQALDGLPLGHFVDFKGPVGRFEYLGRGQCRIGDGSRVVRRFVMICGGSGITPIFQIIRAVMTDAEDETECVVLYGNRTEQDILCREELDAMVLRRPQTLSLQFYLSRPGSHWMGREGRLDEVVLASEVGVPRDSDARDDLVLICGPEAMEKSTKKARLSMGWRDNDLFSF